MLACEEVPKIKINIKDIKNINLNLFIEIYPLEFKHLSTNLSTIMKHKIRAITKSKRYCCC